MQVQITIFSMKKAIIKCDTLKDFDNISRFKAICLNKTRILFQGLTGMVLNFLRTTNKAITIQNIANEINFGMMDCSKSKMLNSMKRHLFHIGPQVPLAVGYDRQRQQQHRSDRGLSGSVTCCQP